jgi:hypothetical protein
MMDEKLFFVKRRKGSRPLFAFLLAATFVFVSCDDFFSTSWGAPRAYDSSKIDVNAGNVDQWIAESAGNPELAEALMEKIKADLEGAEQGALTSEQLALQNAGMKLAIEASGLGTSLISNATSALSDLNNLDNLEEDQIEETVKNLFKNIQGDFRAHGPTAADNLAGIAGYSLTDSLDSLANGGTPQFSQDYRDAVKPADVGMAVVTLALAIIEDKAGDVTGVDLKDLSEIDIPISIGADGKVSITETDKNPEPEIVVLAAYLNLIAEGGGGFESNPITSALRDAFGLAKN